MDTNKIMDDTRLKKILCSVIDLFILWVLFFFGIVGVLTMAVMARFDEVNTESQETIDASMEILLDDLYIEFPFLLVIFYVLFFSAVVIFVIVPLITKGRTLSKVLLKLKSVDITTGETPRALKTVLKSDGFMIFFIPFVFYNMLIIYFIITGESTIPMTHVDIEEYPLIIDVVMSLVFILTMFFAIGSVVSLFVAGGDQTIMERATRTITLDNRIKVTYIDDQKNDIIVE